MRKLFVFLLILLFGFFYFLNKIGGIKVENISEEEKGGRTVISFDWSSISNWYEKKFHFPKKRGLENTLKRIIKEK